MEIALRREGFTAQRKDRTSELADIFPDLGDELADWTITAPGNQHTDLQLAYFDRSREPVLMDVGPVLDLEDVAGSKVCALAGRAERRDYVDTAALLERWTPAELIGFARRLDPGLDGRDLADAATRLDRMPDHMFTPLGLSRQDIATLRERFAVWPRDARVASRAKGGREFSDNSAPRDGREEPTYTREGTGDLQAEANRGHGPAAGTRGRRRPAARERVRDDELEIGR